MIVVAGASGHIGRRVAELLLERVAAVRARPQHSNAGGPRGPRGSGRRRAPRRLRPPGDPCGRVRGREDAAADQCHRPRPAGGAAPRGDRRRRGGGDRADRVHLGPPSRAGQPGGRGGEPPCNRASRDRERPGLDVSPQQPVRGLPGCRCRSLSRERNVHPQPRRRAAWPTCHATTAQPRRPPCSARPGHEGSHTTSPGPTLSAPPSSPRCTRSSAAGRSRSSTSTTRPSRPASSATRPETTISSTVPSS